MNLSVSNNRFYPNGKVISLTSSDEPQSVVGHLKMKHSKLSQVHFWKFAYDHDRDYFLAYAWDLSYTRKFTDSSISSSDT